MIGLMWALTTAVNIGLGLTIGGAFNFAVAAFCALMAVHAWVNES